MRELRVTQVQRLSPGFVAVTFTGDDLAGFTSLSFDDHVKVILPSAADEPARRDYTPRQFDLDPANPTLTIEFVLHGPGAASQWAAQVAPGQTATIGGPRGSMVIPMDYDWHLLAGDTSALPAIHRRLAELPAGARAIVLIEAADAAEERRFETACDLQVQWVRTPEAWLAALRGLALPGGEGFAWCAGEARTMAQARDILLHELGHPQVAMRVSAYWKENSPAFHDSL